LVPIGGGLLLGGSIGNLIDRVWRDGVTDFIAIGPWPPFNVADIGVTVGAILLVLALILSGGDDCRAHDPVHGVTVGRGWTSRCGAG
jgi:signal peptidase II